LPVEILTRFRERRRRGDARRRSRHREEKRERGQSVRYRFHSSFFTLSMNDGHIIFFRQLDARGPIRVALYMQRAGSERAASGRWEGIARGVELFPSSHALCRASFFAIVASTPRAGDASARGTA
jgi:hypothetical protein